MMNFPAIASEPSVATIINTQSGSDTPTTEEAIASTVIPARDLADLARRLGGVDVIPSPPQTPVRDYQLGDTDTFFIHGDFNVFTIDATLHYVNDTAYMWVENGVSTNQDRLQVIADRFETEVYQQVRDVFGSESSPGVDGDTRIHILHSNDLGASVAGYFYSLHEYPKEAIDVSNQREMFFIATSLLNRNQDYYLSVLAHEFQHMIHFAVDANEESWMNEGLAELSAYEAGFGISGFSEVYLNSPYLQLNFWPTGNTTPIYGGGFLFTAYLRERFGTEFIRDLVANPANGMESIDRTLAAHDITDPVTGEPLRVQDVFADFSIANLLNDLTIAPNIYGYIDQTIQTLNAARLTDTFARLPITINGTLNQWSTHYYRAYTVENDELTISFSGSDTVNLLPVAAHSGTYAFWSNRANLSDTRLTRAFDLSGVDTATLQFMTWYDIETEWDYAYLVVSADNGATWDIIPTTRTTTSNPFGTSYGHGYTGESNGWVQETVDLSAYTGSEVLIRFEYVTDDATLGNGMLIDDVAIPEIGFFDDFEGDISEWEIEGWLRTDNQLSQRYTLHMINRYADGTTDVVELLGIADNVPATLTVPVTNTPSEITFALSAYAAITNQPANFSLEILAQ